MNRLAILVIFSSLFACAVPHYCPINLTRAGSKVPLLGVALITDIPGRPLDKCSVLAQITLYTEGDSACRYNNIDLNNALRNRTASMMGNVAVFVQNDIGFYSSGITYSSSVQGMALFCSRESLKSSGIADMVEDTIKSEGADSGSTRSRYNSQTDDQPERVDIRKRGYRNRSNSE